MANPISNWLYTGAAPGTQAATQAAAQTTPWGQVGKQVVAEGALGFKGKPGGFGSVNVGFDPKYTGKGATNIGGYIKGGVQSVLGMGAKGNIGGGTPAGRLAFEKLLQSPLARGVGTVGRLATGPIGAGITAATLGGQLGDWAYKNWEPATKFGDWAGGGIYDLLNPKETSIDPTEKNLFSQYGYDEDEFSGIEGQTAFLDPASLYALLKAGTSKKKIGQYLLKNQILKQTGKKIGPDLRRKIRQQYGEKFGGSGIFKNIATGSKDYGPHTKPKIKPYVAPAGPHSADPPSGNGSGSGVAAGTGASGPPGRNYKKAGGRASYFDGGLLSLWPR